MNFLPKMDRTTLVHGYVDVLRRLYSPSAYYRRIGTFLSRYRPRTKHGILHVEGWQVRAWLHSLWMLGIRDRGRGQYWRFVAKTLFSHPRSFELSMVLAVYGYHFRTVIGRLQTVSTRP
jgi:hypothetical protein